MGQRDKEQGVHGQSAKRRGLGEAHACHGEGIAMEGNSEMVPWFCWSSSRGENETGEGARERIGIHQGRRWRGALHLEPST